jgi:hypothetical protein
MLLSGRQHWERAKLLKRKATRIESPEERRRYHGRQQLHAALALLAWGNERGQVVGTACNPATAPDQIGSESPHGDQ